MNKASTLIVLGSGGHTMEMLEVIKCLNKEWYSPRIYVLAATDTTSKDRVKNIDNESTFIEITRSRNVKQSYFTSIFTTIIALFTSFNIILRIRPNLIICNGPGTCVPICLTAYFLKKICLLKNCKIVFIESFCRVKTLSLSGKILVKFVDLFVVQWPQLQDLSKNIQYFGRLM